MAVGKIFFLMEFHLLKFKMRKTIHASFTQTPDEMIVRATLLSAYYWLGHDGTLKSITSLNPDKILRKVLSLYPFYKWRKETKGLEGLNKTS